MAWRREKGRTKDERERHVALGEAKRKIEKRMVQKFWIFI
jgi:hypothetical protein